MLDLMSLNVMDTVKNVCAREVKMMEFMTEQIVKLLRKKTLLVRTMIRQTQVTITSSVSPLLLTVSRGAVTRDREGVGGAGTIGAEVVVGDPAGAAVRGEVAAARVISLVKPR